MRFDRGNPLRPARASSCAPRTAATSPHHHDHPEGGARSRVRARRKWWSGARRRRRPGPSRNLSATGVLGSPGRRPPTSRARGRGQTSMDRRLRTPCQMDVRSWPRFTERSPGLSRCTPSATEGRPLPPTRHLGRSGSSGSSLSGAFPFASVRGDHPPWSSADPGGRSRVSMCRITFACGDRRDVCGWASASRNAGASRWEARSRARVGAGRPRRGLLAPPRRARGGRGAPSTKSQPGHPADRDAAEQRPQKHALGSSWQSDRGRRR